MNKLAERTYEGCPIAYGKDVLFFIEARYTYALDDSCSMDMTVPNPTDD